MVNVNPELFKIKKAKLNQILQVQSTELRMHETKLDSNSPLHETENFGL